MVKALGRSSPEARIPPRWAAGILAGSGLLLVALGEFWLDLDRQYQVLLLCAMIHITSLAAWMLAESRPRLSIWLVVCVSVGTVFLGTEWLRIPSFLSLLPLPVVLAVALGDALAGLTVAIAETTLAALSPALGATFFQSPPARGIAIGSIWVAYALVVALYHPISRWADWLEDYASSLRRFADEARDRRAELEQTAESLAHANRQLALANERTAMLREIAETAQQAKTTFVANVSHEFRTPLNMIIGLVDLMMRSPGRYDVVLSPKMRNDLETVHRNCLHLADMVDDVLDLTRTETDRLTLHRESTSLAAVIEESAAVVRPLVQDKGLELQMVVEDDIPEVRCDRTRIRQVILNLLSNAARFTEQGGVTIRAARQDRQVCVQVRDTGAGIPQEDVERIFEPFWQRARPSNRAPSSGLGLSISRQLVRRHGGRMWAESELGIGTSFFFTLPLGVLPDVDAQPVHRIRSDWPWRERAFKTESTVEIRHLRRPRLILWDETGALSRAWSSYSEEIEFVSVTHLDELVEVLDACPAHAIVVNSGDRARLWPLVERIKSGARGLPVLGCAMAGHAQPGAELGVLAQLVKPVTFQDVERALRTLDEPPRRVLVVDDDPEVLQLFRQMLELYDRSLEIDTASSGAQALDVLSHTRPDIMLLDLVMPDMSGWQLLERHGADRTRVTVPTFLVSAQDPAQDEQLSALILASVEGGVPAPKALSCSLFLSRLLMPNQREPYPEPL